MVRAPSLPVDLTSLSPNLLVDAQLVARALGLSARQVRRLGIPFVDLGPRSKRFRVRDVLAHIESRVRAA